MSKINWFPGHMNKALRQIQDALQKADFVVELRDARAPLASANPLLQELIQGMQGSQQSKPQLIILNKADLADPKANEAWQQYFSRKHNMRVLALSSLASGAHAKQKLTSVLRLSFGGHKKKGPEGAQWKRASRGLLVGIPNVGKSTLINTLSGKHKAKVEDRAGVTRQVNIIPINQDYTLLDSPGVLWPNLEDQHAAARLALMGSIKEQILEEEQQLCFAVQELERFYPKVLFHYYQKPNIAQDEQVRFLSSQAEFQDSLQKAIRKNGIAKMTEPTASLLLPDLNMLALYGLLEGLARNLQCLEKGGRPNYRRLLSRIFRDYQQGRLGKLSLEFPG